MNSIELERTYLAKHLPEGLENCESKIIADTYFPAEAKHPQLRLRRKGDKYEITKKYSKAEDWSEQIEETIVLSEEEYNALAQTNGKKFVKQRYLYPYQGKIAEVDVYQEALKGLVVVDFEFDDPNEKNAFEMPNFCLVDVTQEVFTAGGMLCGKKYEDIAEKLENLGYKKIV